MTDIRFLTACAVAAIALGTAAAGPAEARGPQCGTTYRVAPGDSLSAIARSVYGDATRFRAIYDANAAAIGPNPALINVGMALEIPCEGQAASAPAATEVAAVDPVTVTDAAPAAGSEGLDRPIRVLTAGNWAPYLDETDENGGMIVEIVTAAFAAVEPEPDYKIDFINDWSAHLQPLLSDHAYDIGLVWFRPNCDVVERLGEGSRFRCTNLAWSEPLYEQPIGYWMRADAVLPETHAELMGRHFCRPDGYSIFMMEEHGLVEPAIVFTRATTPQACFEGLLDGTYDVVVLANDVSEGALDELGAQGRAVAPEALTQIATLNAVIARDHPQAEEILAVLDEGVRRIKASTEWFSIVRRHVEAHRQKVR